MSAPRTARYLDYNATSPLRPDARAAMLAALDLPFEEACLQFHQTERPVRTPSSQQVRSPIFRQGTENWQAYDQWLGPLREALGDLAEG